MEQLSTTAPQEPRQAVVPAPGSWLDQKMAEHHAAKIALADAEMREKDLRIEIEAALATAHPGMKKFDIAGTADYPAKTMIWVTGRTRVDERRLKEEQPGTWAAYARTGKGHWELRPAGGLG